MSELISIGGQTYEITNWDEFVAQVMFIMKEALLNEVQEEAIRMGLFDSGAYVRSMFAQSSGDTITLGATAPYAAFLEYGTYEFGGRYGTEDFPSKPFPKKKNLSRQAREQFPRGMQPFAPFRRVLYSQSKIDKVLGRAFS